MKKSLATTQKSLPTIKKSFPTTQKSLPTIKKSFPTIRKGISSELRLNGWRLPAAKKKRLAPLFMVSFLQLSP